MKWEYLTIYLKCGVDGYSRFEINDALSTEGAKGWELVSIYGVSDFDDETEKKVFATFKKPLG